MSDSLDWVAWKEQIWDSLEARLGYPGLDALEQYTIRSAKETRCVRCGATGTIKYRSTLIKVVDAYWMCDDCDADVRS